MGNTKIPPLCPSLSRWFGKKSDVEKLGRDGDGPRPAEAGMTNLETFALLFARNAGEFSMRWGNFEGPFGLTLQDALLLTGSLMYVRGHLDACGMPQDEQQEFIAAALEPEIKKFMAMHGLDGDVAETEESNEVQH